jgi:hypothetical protein
MAPAVITLEGAVQSGVSDPVAEGVILDDDATTPREVLPAAAASISAAGVTGYTGSGDDVGPPAGGE